MRLVDLVIISVALLPCDVKRSILEKCGLSKFYSEVLKSSVSDTNNSEMVEEEKKSQEESRAFAIERDGDIYTNDLSVIEAALYDSKFVSFTRLDITNCKIYNYGIGQHLYENTGWAPGTSKSLYYISASSGFVSPYPNTKQKEIISKISAPNPGFVICARAVEGMLKVNLTEEAVITIDLEKVKNKDYLNKPSGEFEVPSQGRYFYVSEVIE